MNQPKERPILFRGEMVNAILDGRKTQTRRAIKPQPEQPSEGSYFDAYNGGPQWNWWSPDHKQYLSQIIKCPYGKPSDRLWVRETFQGPLVSNELAEELYEDNSKFQNPEYFEYRADGGPTPVYVDSDGNERHGWKPSIFMPRWASRLLLEITDVRVERLQDISEEDARAEGVTPEYLGHNDPEGDAWECRRKFNDLWQSINGPDSWSANPWGWVVEFKGCSHDQRIR